MFIWGRSDGATHRARSTEHRAQQITIYALCQYTGIRRQQQERTTPAEEATILNSSTQSLMCAGPAHCSFCFIAPSPYIAQHLKRGRSKQPRQHPAQKTTSWSRVATSWKNTKLVCGHDTLSSLALGQKARHRAFLKRQCVALYLLSASSSGAVSCISWRRSRPSYRPSPV